MTLSIRRVVTDHDQEGQSVVRFDEITSNIVSRRPGHSSTVIWSHADTPVDNTEERDGGLRDVDAPIQKLLTLGVRARRQVNGQRKSKAREDPLGLASPERQRLGVGKSRDDKGRHHAYSSALRARATRGSGTS